MPLDPSSLLPLKPIVFHILIVLFEGERHGWALLKAVEERLGSPLLPGQLYRQLAAMLGEGLIEESAAPPRAARRREEGVGGAAPSRFFTLTPFGRAVAAAEARRHAAIVDELRGTRLLPQKERS